MVSNERNGRLVGAVQVQDGEEIMLISDQGTLVRTRVDEVSSLGRNTQGVTLIKLASDETLVGLERVQEPSEVEGDELEGEGEAVQSSTVRPSTMAQTTSSPRIAPRVAPSVEKEHVMGQLSGLDYSGKVVLVTGGTKGIGACRLRLPWGL